MNGRDPHDLRRFLRAQDEDYEVALAEIRAGRKHSHWMWYVFPQYAGLGHSETARRYAVGSLAEARAYLAHPVLGSRLEQISTALLRHRGRSLREIFGSPDDLKLRSSATLFAAASPPGSVYERLLEAFCDGAPDARTLELLRADGELA